MTDNLSHFFRSGPEVAAIPAGSPTDPVSAFIRPAAAVPDETDRERWREYRSPSMGNSRVGYQEYFKDSEGNVIGIREIDPSAR